MSNELILDPGQAKVFKEQIKMWVESQLLPNHIDTYGKAFTIAQIGRELAIPPMTAFSSVYVVNGKPSLSAEMMLGLIKRDCKDAVINFKELSNEKCTISVKRDDKHDEFVITFTMDDAKNAGIANGNTWKKYPRAMLRSRCVSEMARTVFPDVLAGFTYTPEELGAEVSQDGKPIDVNSPEPESNPPRLQEQEPPPTGHQIKDLAEDSLPNHAQPIIDKVENEKKNEPEILESQPEDDTQKVSVLEQLEQAKQELRVVDERDPDPEFDIEDEPTEIEPGSSFGDYVFEVGRKDVAWYGLRLAEIEPKLLYKIRAFLTKRDEASGLDTKEQETLFMVDNYIENFQAEHR